MNSIERTSTAEQYSSDVVWMVAGSASDYQLGSEPKRSDDRRLSRFLLDSIGNTETGAISGTIIYRLRGQDTLSIGNPAKWAEANFIRYSVARRSQTHPQYQILDSYSELKQVMSASRIAQVTKVFETDKDTRVTDFLACNLSLIDWLIESHTILRHHFDSDTRFLLKVVLDPDMSGESYLRICIETRLSVDEAMAKLDNFDTAWFFDQIDMVGNKVVFNLAFV